ncbi:UDP-2,3-diacylglucosamine diphosphatase, partial [Cupriavidus sp. 2MCAB6]|uniref:UDP-2,3-diacylglucosamine diphosphatase n=1 Tax=Cupriavidus sp. 2MCAB6 TaxID=3232981 RepID=UPI003F8F810C
MTVTQSTPAAGALAVPAPAWFISDLHLTAEMPRTLASFERVLERAAQGSRALFILGDFFEFWVGDEEADSPFAAQVAAMLRQLASRGVQVYLMHGNRDFLLGQRFARAAGAALLPDPTVIECADQRVVLSHGDMLCTDDERYMKFRRWTRKRWVQRAFLSLPLTLRLR